MSNEEKKEQEGGLIENIAETLGEAVGSAAEAVSEVAESVSEVVSSVAETVTGSSDEATAGGEEAADDSAETVVEKVVETVADTDVAAAAEQLVEQVAESDVASAAKEVVAKVAETDVAEIAQDVAAKVADTDVVAAAEEVVAEAVNFFAPQPEEEETGRNERKTRVGLVASNKMDKTISVTIQRRLQHPIYGKYVKKSKKLIAHDAENDCQIGDLVRIMECRPLSRRKRWRLVEVIERAK